MPCLRAAATSASDSINPWSAPISLRAQSKPTNNLYSPKTPPCRWRSGFTIKIGGPLFETDTLDLERGGGRTTSTAGGLTGSRGGVALALLGAVGSGRVLVVTDFRSEATAAWTACMGSLRKAGLRSSSARKRWASASAALEVFCATSSRCVSSRMRVACAGSTLVLGKSESGQGMVLWLPRPNECGFRSRIRG